MFKWFWTIFSLGAPVEYTYILPINLTLSPVTFISIMMSSLNFIRLVRVVITPSVGTLSDYDDNGSENIAKKMNFRPFKLYRVHLEPLNSSNVGDFSWNWILKGFTHVQIKKGNFFSSYVHVLHKTCYWEVSRRSRAVDVKEMYSKAWRTCRAVVLIIKPIVF